MWDLISAIGDFIGGLFGAGAHTANTILQQQQFDYQKKLQQQIFAREDSAYQRQVADLERAGLNKSLAYGSGGAGTGSVVGVSAPQINSAGLSNAMQSMAKGLKGLTNKQRNLLNAGYKYEMDKIDAQRQAFNLNLDYLYERNNLMREQVKMAQSDIVAKNLANEINQNWYALEDWDRNEKLKDLWYDVQENKANADKLYSQMDKSTAEPLDKSFIKIDIDGVTHELSVGASLAYIQLYANKNGLKNAQFTGKTLDDAIKRLGFDKFMERFNVILGSAQSMVDIANGVKSLINPLSFGGSYSFGRFPMRNVSPLPYGGGYSPYFLQ